MLLSLLLSSLLVASLMQLYVNSKRQYHHTKTIVEEALDLLLIKDLIVGSARRAGFTPCININLLKTHGKTEILRALYTHADNVGTSQSLHINHMDENFSKVLEIQSPNTVLIANNKHIIRNKNILIADCYHAEVKSVDVVKIMQKASLITFKDPIFFNYTPPVYFGEWLEETFFIQPNQQGNQALFYKNNRSEELSAKIDHLSATITGSQLEVVLAKDSKPVLTIVATPRNL